MFYGLARLKSYMEEEGQNLNDESNLRSRSKVTSPWPHLSKVRSRTTYFESINLPIDTVSESTKVEDTKRLGKYMNVLVIE